MKITYTEVREDFEYLESLAALEDSWDVESLVWELMRNVTKSTAAEMYYIGIKRWFKENDWIDFAGDSILEEIAERYQLFG